MGCCSTDEATVTPKSLDEYYPAPVKSKENFKLEKITSRSSSGNVQKL